MNPAGDGEVNAAARILLVHNDAQSRRSWREALHSAPELEVVGEAADAQEALNTVLMVTPDVAVIHLGLPGISGIELTQEILRRQSKVAVVICSGRQGVSRVAESFQAGAKSYLPGDSPAELVEAVRSVCRGRCYFTGETRPVLTDMLLDEYVTRQQRRAAANRWRSLTAREREILRRLISGKTNKEIAREFDLSVHTVDTHRARILQKLKVHSLTELTAYVLLGEGPDSAAPLDGELHF